MEIGYCDRLDDKYCSYLRQDFPKSSDQKKPQIIPKDKFAIIMRQNCATQMAYFSSFMLSSRLMASLISLVFQAIHFIMSGSMENFWRLSELGALYTQTVKCSGITVQTPILLMPCFFSKSPNFSGNPMLFFSFSHYLLDSSQENA